VGQPLAGFEPITSPDSSPVRLTDRLVPLGPSLQSIRPDLSQGASVLGSPKRPFLHLSLAPIMSVGDGWSLGNSETVIHTPVLESFHGIRSPPPSEIS
jgi:hypothetical protein